MDIKIEKTMIPTKTFIWMPGLATTQVLQIFIKYARSHPETLGLPAAAVALNAMADAFPCEETR